MCIRDRENVVQPEESDEPQARSSAKIIDLTELLQRSLRKGGGEASKVKVAGKTTARTTEKASTKAAARSPARKKPAAKARAHAPARRRAA